MLGLSQCVYIWEKVSKTSLLYNNLGLKIHFGDQVCGQLTHNGVLLCDELKATGKSTHGVHIGQRNCLSHGDEELRLRCEIPVKLSVCVIREAMLLRGGKPPKNKLFVIDVCCGWQSVKNGVLQFENIEYIGVDVDKIKQMGNDQTVQTDYVVDLS